MAELTVYPELRNVLTLRQCASRLGVREHVVRRLVREKVIPCLRLDGWLILLRVRDVEAYERQHSA